MIQVSDIGPSWLSCVYRSCRRYIAFLLGVFSVNDLAGVEILV